jgi:Protein of unknown function (DUF2510)
VTDDPFADFRGVPPGWYRDPSNPRMARYWNGRSLSAEARPIPAHASQQPPPPSRLQPQVKITRRFRMRRLPCGHCSQKLPRFEALAPAIMTCPVCGGLTQVMGGILFRRGYGVSSR